MGESYHSLSFNVEGHIAKSYTQNHINMSGDEEILFLLNLKSGIFCSCYDVTRKSWKKLEINGLTTKRPIRGIYSYVERLVNIETNSLSF